jgi:hypothetical protein
MWRRRRGVNLVDTPEMEEFFDRLDHMNDVQLLAMRAAWRARSRGEHEDAWAAVRAAGAEAGLTSEIDRVRRKAMAWTARGSNAIPFRGQMDYDWQQVKLEAGEAIVDAALATALGPRLDARHRGVLIEPWLRATEAASGQS